MDLNRNMNFHTIDYIMSSLPEASGSKFTAGTGDYRCHSLASLRLVDLNFFHDRPILLNVCLASLRLVNLNLL